MMSRPLGSVYKPVVGRQSSVVSKLRRRLSELCCACPAGCGPNETVAQCNYWQTGCWAADACRWASPPASNSSVGAFENIC
ncbi:hypothetical protein Y032_0073g782 [Ancylostoma ceylanicum]|uniref:Uncharacterized protein n=1 Tax=Ancylostoma ceylanicum TaxID=53326 RepID=A0A016TVV0_9BILA|nr:hypothetical protein Y032_0073g782 [Ancylostoma ceylanicum]